MTVKVSGPGEPLKLAPAHPELDRIDLVVWRDQEVAVVTGTPAAQPAPPPCPDGWSRQATVRVAAGATTGVIA